MGVLDDSWLLVTSEGVYIVIIRIRVEGWILDHLPPYSVIDCHLVPFMSDMVLTTMQRVYRVILVFHQIRPQLIPNHSLSIGLLLKRVRFVRC